MAFPLVKHVEQAPRSNEIVERYGPRKRSALSASDARCSDKTVRLSGIANTHDISRDRHRVAAFKEGLIFTDTNTIPAMSENTPQKHFSSHDSSSDRHYRSEFKEDQRYMPNGDRSNSSRVEDTPHDYNTYDSSSDRHRVAAFKEGLIFTDTNTIPAMSENTPQKRFSSHDSSSDRHYRSALKGYQRYLPNADRSISSRVEDTQHDYNTYDSSRDRHRLAAFKDGLIFTDTNTIHARPENTPQKHLSMYGSSKDKHYAAALEENLTCINTNSVMPAKAECTSRQHSSSYDNSNDKHYGATSFQDVTDTHILVLNIDTNPQIRVSEPICDQITTIAGQTNDGPIGMQNPSSVADMRTMFNTEAQPYIPKQQSRMHKGSRDTRYRPYNSNGIQAKPFPHSDGTYDSGTQTNQTNTDNGNSAIYKRNTGRHYGVSFIETDSCSETTQTHTSVEKLACGRFSYDRNRGGALWTRHRYSRQRQVINAHKRRQKSVIPKFLFIINARNFAI